MPNGKNNNKDNKNQEQFDDKNQEQFDDEQSPQKPLVSDRLVTGKVPIDVASFDALSVNVTVYLDQIQNNKKKLAGIGHILPVYYTKSH